MSGMSCVGDRYFKVSEVVNQNEAQGQAGCMVGTLGRVGGEVIGLRHLF